MVWNTERFGHSLEWKERAEFLKVLRICLECWNFIIFIVLLVWACKKFEYKNSKVKVLSGIFAPQNCFMGLIFVPSQIYRKYIISTNICLLSVFLQKGLWGVNCIEVKITRLTVIYYMRNKITWKNWISWVMKMVLVWWSFMVSMPSKPNTLFLLSFSGTTIKEPSLSYKNWGDNWRVMSLEMQEILNVLHKYH